ncbi:hypothetical protein [Streptomyces sp. NPDC005828]|uniref:hypothetical protein n=1 Tax=Streptomyces sp. NPDC005828 TaxID=3157071 RepID=UPI0033FFAE25
MAAHHAVNGPASNPAAPADVLLRLLALDDDWIAHLLSCRAALPDSVAEAMLRHPGRRVQTRLAESAAADPALRARLLDGPASDAMAVAVGPIAYRTPVPPPPDRAYERLLNHERGMVRYETVQSAGVPAHVLVPLAGHEDPAARLAVSARPELPEEERAAIDWTVRPEDRLDTLWWMWETREDTDLLRRCATSAHTWLRRSAAVCPKLPEDCVELLAGDADFAVRLLLAEFHPTAPPELLLDLFLHGTHRAVGSLTSRPQFPAAGLAARFGDASEPEARRPALRDPGATPALVERLSRDPAVRVREAAALDRRLPVARLLELLEDPEVGRAAACNPLLPVPEMRALLDRAGVPGL